MDAIFGNKIGKSELAALRALLAAHTAVGVDFHEDAKQLATVTLVWPASTGASASELASAPWVISEHVVGRTQFQSLLRTLFLEGRATKALHRVSAVAHWMATHGLVNVMAAARNVVDLQLYYERVVDPLTRTAPLPLILEATSKQVDESDTATTTTTHELYRTLLSEQLRHNAIKSQRNSGPALAHTLLQHSVQRAHLCLVCLDRIMSKHFSATANKTAAAEVGKRELMALAQRRFQNASRVLPHHELIWFAARDKYAPRSIELLGDDAHVTAIVPRIKRHCDIEMLLALLSPNLWESVMAIDGFEDRLVAISLDVGSKPRAYVASRTGGETECVELHKSKPTNTEVPTPSKLFGAFRKKPASDLEDAKGGSGGSSEEISHEELLGVVAMAGGADVIDPNNRVGVDRQLHRLAVVRSKGDQIVGLTLRVGRTVQFASNPLLDLLHAPQHRAKSVLVLGSSGAGKTSLLRDIARRLSTGSERVCIVDTTGEIGGDGAVAHRSVDRATRFTVESLEKTADVIVESVQNHLVDTLLVDEVTNARDVRALAFAKSHCRHRVVAGCAVRDLHALLDDLEMNRLVGGVQTVMKSQDRDDTGDEPYDEEFAVKHEPEKNAKKQPLQQRKQRERVTAPVVDVIVELNASRLGKFRIVWDVARAVDDALAGRGYECEMRVQTPEMLGVQVEIK